MKIQYEYFWQLKDKRTFIEDAGIHWKLKKFIVLYNFILVERYTSPRSIINDSDLVVSMTFATPGFEALYLKKKSFFVDTNSNYKNSLIEPP